MARYRVVDANWGEFGDPSRDVWTVSQDDQDGWITDDGYPGYGLTKEEAVFLAAAANAYIDSGHIPPPQSNRRPPPSA